MFKFFGKKIRELFQTKFDASQLDKLEKMLYDADLGVELSEQLVETVRQLLRKNPDIKSDEIIEHLKRELKSQFQLTNLDETVVNGPKVYLIVGVNGNGKTTSCAKLAKRLQDQGKKVLFAAADTFRAAAIDQLELWANNVGIDIVKAKTGSDPGAVVFDAIQAAQSRGKDIVIIDTAGRLHTKNELMRELEKIRRVCGKAKPGTPNETLLVLDATIGQNALEQAKIFHQFTPISGLILTKIDGTAKGGAVVAIQKKLGIPIKYVGTGEGMNDFQPFNPESFIDDLFAS